MRNVETYLNRNGISMRKGKNYPLTSNYRPECNISAELALDESSYYALLIGVLRWIVEMGQLDFCCEVSMMSYCVAIPREVHFQQLYHMFSYLNLHHNAILVLYLTYPGISHNDFERRYWKEFYRDLSEPIPPNSPSPLGK